VPKTERLVAEGAAGGPARRDAAETQRQRQDAMCGWVDHTNPGLGGRENQPVAVCQVVRHLGGESAHGVHEGRRIVDLLPRV
jgi:hypothetical protein